MTKEKPILFDEVMIRAILAGQKTQTRCASKHQPVNGQIFNELAEDYKNGLAEMIGFPYGKPGDHLWVREKHAIECPYGPANECDNPDHVIYWATAERFVRDSVTAPWRPSIHMPRWASRITLEIKTVRFEQLQTISLEDCYAEGIKDVEDGVGILDHKFGFVKELFIDLWNAINETRAYGWAVNPWVWVLEFERVTDATDITA